MSQNLVDMTNVRQHRVAMPRPLIMGLLFITGFLAGFGVAGYTLWQPLRANANDTEATAVSASVDPIAGVTAIYEPPPLPRSASGEPYSIAARRRSFFSLDAEGTMQLRDGLPYRSEREYTIERIIDPNRSAFVVMDPWVDMGSDYLNDYFGEIIESRIVPMIESAIAYGHPVIVLTNDPEKVEYASRVHVRLETAVNEHKAVMLYHYDLDDRTFAAYLRSQGIDTLIYCGLASNMCVIGRPMGMIPMVHKGFRLYFIPEASAAVEYGDTWVDQAIHSAMTMVISQWIAELIDLNELFDALAVPRHGAVDSEPPQLNNP